MTIVKKVIVHLLHCMIAHICALFNSTVGTELLLSMLQHLAGLTMPSVLVYLLEYLKLIQVAAQFPSIPVDVSTHTGYNLLMALFLVYCVARNHDQEFM